MKNGHNYAVLCILLLFSCSEASLFRGLSEQESSKDDKPETADAIETTELSATWQAQLPAAVSGVNLLQCASNIDDEKNYSYICKSQVPAAGNWNIQILAQGSLVPAVVQPCEQEICDFLILVPPQVDGESAFVIFEPGDGQIYAIEPEPLPPGGHDIQVQRSTNGILFPTANESGTKFNSPTFRLSESSTVEIQCRHHERRWLVIYYGSTQDQLDIYTLHIPAEAEVATLLSWPAAGGSWWNIGCSGQLDITVLK